MLYQISGKQIDIGAALQTHVKSVVDAIASKYAERPTDASETKCYIKFPENKSTLALHFKRM